MSERRNKLSSAPPLPTLSPVKEPDTLEPVVTKSSKADEGAEDVNGDVVTGAKDVNGDVVTGAEDVNGDVVTGAEDVNGDVVTGAEDDNGDVVTVADSFSDIPIRTANKSKYCSYSIFNYNL